MRSVILYLTVAITLVATSTLAKGKTLQLNDSIKVVFKDTIHVHGKVVDEMGNPLRGIYVTTGRYDGLVQMTTKADGNFLLKNVQPNDTLFFSGSYGYTKIHHGGSRILNVTFPKPMARSFEGTTITAKRLVAKEDKNSTEKFEVFTGCSLSFEFPPEYPGGNLKLYKDLNAKIKFPRKAQTANIEGTVKIEFLVNAKGNPIDFRTVQGLGYGCEEAVIEILKGTKWKPGIINGLPYSAPTSVEVLFKLEEM